MAMTEARRINTTAGPVPHRPDGDPAGRRCAPLAALWLCALLLFGPGTAHAGRGYVGLGIGAAGSTVDETLVEFDTEDWSASGTTWRLLAGYQLVRHIGIEGGYASLGKASVTADGGYNFETELTQFEIAPVGILPVGRNLSLFLRPGLVFWSSDISYNYASGSGTGDESGSAFSVSVGAEYFIARQFGVRAEYSRCAIDKGEAGSGDYNLISLSGLFAF
jgi:hypothetical protein